jgi:hypothetical protein
MNTLEVKLNVEDTRESLMEQKLIAEAAFLQVSTKYHVVWLKIINETNIDKLSNIKSYSSGVIKHKPMACQVAAKEYLDMLCQSISYNMDEFKSIMNRLQLFPTVTIVIAPLKCKKRIWEKALFDYKKDQSYVVDIGRGSAIVDELHQIVDITEWILKNCHVIRLKNRFCDGRKQIISRGGYRDVLININLNGFVFEIQLHLKALYLLKEESHEILNISRAVIEQVLYKLNLLDKMQEKEQLLSKIRQLQEEIQNVKIEHQLSLKDSKKEATEVKTEPVKFNIGGFSFKIDADGSSLAKLQENQEAMLKKMNELPQQFVRVLEYVLQLNLENSALVSRMMHVEKTHFPNHPIDSENEVIMRKKLYKEALEQGSKVADEMGISELSESWLKQSSEL